MINILTNELLNEFIKHNIHLFSDYIIVKDKNTGLRCYYTLENSNTLLDVYDGMLQRARLQIGLYPEYMRPLDFKMFKETLLNG